MASPRNSIAQASDDTLLVLYANGDPEAARMLSLRLAPRAQAYATRILGDRAEAEDVVQEAMLRLWRVAPDWRPGEARVSTWVYRVVSNLCIDRKRAAARRRTFALDEAPDLAGGGPDAAALLMRARRMQALEEALGTLPERQRQAVVLRHIEGLANPEIARILEVGVEAVESLTARGKRALAAALRDRRDALGFRGEAEE